jgi:AmmeMemoRadiSam system protein B
MSTVRYPAVAGQFYPDDPRELREAVLRYLGKAKPVSSVPKAIIAPHAGYIYSGPVAAFTYAAIAPAHAVIRRVILLGPAHRVYLRGLALSSADDFVTPLGIVPVDREAVARIQHLPQVVVMDAAHTLEHSLEVHLPFLQVILDQFSLVPLVVGDASPEAVDEVLELLWGGEETLIVVSSDLSHYHSHAMAKTLDSITTQAIEALRADIEPEQACGCMPLNGLLHLARRHGLRVTTLDLRNSGDTAGPRDQVVGYGAYVLH